MKKKYVMTLFFTFCTLYSAKSLSENFTTAEIMAQSINMECVDYCVVGVCYYLICTPFGCDIETQPRIRHYLPDLFVTVYDEPDENPWQEYQALMGNTEVAVRQGIISEAAGSTTGGGEMRIHQSPGLSEIKFKETSVVGHPLNILTQENITGYVCESDVTPFMPYFSSAFDHFAWRFGIPDRFTLDALIPGRREIGSKTTTNYFGNSWGSIYPRFGFLLQHNDAKAAAVFAQRSVDIVTRSGQPHVYNPINGYNANFSFDDLTESQENESHSDLDGNIDSSEEEENPMFSDQTGKQKEHVSLSGPSNEKKDKWQMFSLKLDSSCKAFGSNDARWQEGRTDEHHQYGMNYWRQYECCVPGIGVYVGHSPIPPVCVN